MLILIFTILQIVSCQRTVPLQKIDKDWYLKLKLDYVEGLFRLDIQQPLSYLTEGLTDRIGHRESLDGIKNVRTGTNSLGRMAFEPYKKKQSDVDVIGTIGLGVNSTFIRMLEQEERQMVGLQLDLQKQTMLIKKKSCRNPREGPFVVDMATWANFSILTNPSFNFEPPEDFLALMATTKQPIILSDKEYSTKTMTVTYLGHTVDVHVKDLLSCMSGSKHKQCTFEVGGDVGILLFRFPIVFCRLGIEYIGHREEVYEYDLLFIMGLLVNIITLSVFLNWAAIRQQLKEEKILPDFTYLPPSLEKLTLIPDLMQG